jgi:hypothetical protein
VTEKRKKRAPRKKKTLTSIVTMKKIPLNHAKRATKGAMLVLRTTAVVPIAVCTALQ